MLKLNLEKWQPGQRVAKSGVAAGICVLLFYLMERGSPALACLGAVFAVRSNVDASIYFGLRRILATLLGGVLAVLLIALKQATSLSFIMDFLGIMFFVALFIVMCNVFDLSEGIIGGLAAFFFIYFEIAPSESFIDAFDRVMDTLIGSGVAVILNILVPSKEK